MRCSLSLKILWHFVSPFLLDAQTWFILQNAIFLLLMKTGIHIFPVYFSILSCDGGVRCGQSRLVSGSCSRYSLTRLLRDWVRLFPFHSQSHQSSSDNLCCYHAWVDENLFHKQSVMKNLCFYHCLKKKMRQFFETNINLALFVLEEFSSIFPILWVIWALSLSVTVSPPIPFNQLMS